MLNDIRTRLFEKKYFVHTKLVFREQSEMDEFDEFDEVDEFVELVRTKKDVTIICEYLNSHPQVLEDFDVSF